MDISNQILSLLSCYLIKLDFHFPDIDEWILVWKQLGFAWLFSLKT